MAGFDIEKLAGELAQACIGALDQMQPELLRQSQETIAQNVEMDDLREKECMGLANHMSVTVSSKVGDGKWENHLKCGLRLYGQHLLLRLDCPLPGTNYSAVIADKQLFAGKVAKPVAEWLREQVANCPYGGLYNAKVRLQFDAEINDKNKLSFEMTETFEDPARLAAWRGYLLESIRDKRYLEWALDVNDPENTIMALDLYDSVSMREILEFLRYGAGAFGAVPFLFNMRGGWDAFFEKQKQKEKLTQQEAEGLLYLYEHQDEMPSRMDLDEDDAQTALMLAKENGARPVK